MIKVIGTVVRVCIPLLTSQQLNVWLTIATSLKHLLETAVIYDSPSTFADNTQDSTKAHNVCLEEVLRVQIILLFTFTM